MARKRAGLPRGGRSVLAKLSPRLASTKPAPGWSKRAWQELRSGLVKAQRGEKLGPRQRQRVTELRESVERAKPKDRPKRLSSLLEKRAAAPHEPKPAPAPAERPKLAPEVARGDLPWDAFRVNETALRNRGFSGGEKLNVEDQHGKVIGRVELPTDLSSRAQWRGFWRRLKKLYRKGVKAMWVYV